MAQRFSRNFLSNGDSGVLVSGSDESSTWNLVHTSTTTDEVWLYGMNTLDVAATLNVGWCSTVSTGTPDGSTITLDLPALSGIFLVIPGLIMPAARSILVNVATDDTASAVVVYGFVNSIETV